MPHKVGSPSRLLFAEGVLISIPQPRISLSSEVTYAFRFAGSAQVRAFEQSPRYK
jgi:hypothetical protein